MQTVDCSEVCTVNLGFDELYGSERGVGIGNLNTCGLFTTVATLPTHIFLSPSNESYLHEYSPRFQAIGLNISNATQILLAQQAITEFLFTLADGGTSGLMIAGQSEYQSPWCAGLYPVISQGWLERLPPQEYLRPLQLCVNDICADKKLDEDLAGIGVSKTMRQEKYFLNQIFIAGLYISAATVVLRYLSLRGAADLGKEFQLVQSLSKGTETKAGYNTDRISQESMLYHLRYSNCIAVPTGGS